MKKTIYIIVCIKPFTTIQYIEIVFFYRRSLHQKISLKFFESLCLSYTDILSLNPLPNRNLRNFPTSPPVAFHNLLVQMIENYVAIVILRGLEVSSDCNCFNVVWVCFPGVRLCYNIELWSDWKVVGVVA